jgi:hypothetical protein
MTPFLTLEGHETSTLCTKVDYYARANTANMHSLSACDVIHGCAPLKLAQFPPLSRTSTAGIAGISAVYNMIRTVIPQTECHATDSSERGVVSERETLV